MTTQRAAKRSANPGPPTPTPDEKIDTVGTLAWLRADKLHVDPAYQRGINERKARQIAREFDPDALGVLYVSQRSTGEYMIMDGLQRHSALMIMGWGDQRVPCHVYHGLALSQEADLFHRFNEVRTKPRPLDLYRAALVAGDEEAHRLDRVVRAHGLSINDQPGHGKLRSVGSLRAIVAQAGGDVLDRTFTIIGKAWGFGGEGLHGDILAAVAVLLARHSAKLDDARLARTLSKLDPSGVLRKARVLRVEMGLGNSGGTGTPRLAATLAGMFVRDYNLRLPDEDRIEWDPEAVGAAFWKQAVR